MKITILIAIVVLTLCAPALADGPKNYSETIDVFKNSSVVRMFFANSYGYAIFPTIGKAGFVIGGSYGEGQVYRKGTPTGKTTVVEGSIGWQIGGKAFSQIIFFQNKRAYDKFTSGNFEFDVTAQATVITAGAEIGAGTTGASAGANAGSRTGVQAEADYINGMAIFVHTKGGLMYELSVGGQKFSFKPY